MLPRHPPLRNQSWQRYRVKDGEKGPQVWEVKQLFIYPKDADGLPNRRYHLLVARNVLDPPTIKYFISNAPPETSVETLLLVAFSRWHVERCFEDEKGEIGLDHYEGRKYPGLKRHLIISAVSHLFLAKVQQDLVGKKSRPDRLPGPYRHGERRAEPLAIRPRRCPIVRTNRPGTLLLPKTQCPSPKEPHQDRATQASQTWHSPNHPSPLSLGHDIAL
jgi:hypothetical protein